MGSCWLWRRMSYHRLRARSRGYHKSKLPTIPLSILINNFRQLQLVIWNKTYHSAYHAHPRPQLVFVVVTKRIQQRFFWNQGGRLSNPSPGTIVDTELTKPEFFDFFLVPQSVGQGTVTPTHYNVLEFNTTLTPDHLQKIAYKLCHVYYNWTVSLTLDYITNKTMPCILHAAGP